MKRKADATRGKSQASPPAPPDEKPLRDLIAGGLALPAVLVAHELGLFRLLAGGARNIVEVGEALGLGERPADVLLTLCTAQGLLERRGERYALGVLAERFFVPGAADDFGAYWDLLLANPRLTSPAAIRAALQSDAPPPHEGGTGGPAARRLALTRAMHARGAASARVWPDRIDLSGARVLLDLGGGSGVHAIEAVRRWPGLRAIVFDRPAVCDVASEYVIEAGLADRIAVQPGDLRDATPLPPADVHLCSDVLHNASPQENLALLERCHRSLPPGGRLLVHEMLLDDDRTGPPAVAAASLLMLLWTHGGRQYTAGELRGLLARAAFHDIQVHPSGGYYSLLAATRAARTAAHADT